MAIQVQASVNAGAYAAGKSVVVASDAFQLRLNPQTIAEVWSVRWEIYEAPTGFTTPAGWTADANGLSWYYVATSTTALMPPSVTLGSLWGKYLIRATANAGVLGGVVTTDAVDETCCLVMLSPEGVENIAALEENQSDPRGALAIVKLAIETLVPSNGFETYNVLLYGADPTGVADSTAAIQAAIDAASAAGGGEVFLPTGVFSIGATPLGMASGVSLRGVNSGNSILRLDAAQVARNSLILELAGGFSNIDIRDIGFEGIWLANQSEVADNALLTLRYCTNVRVHRCRFSYSRAFSLQMRFCQNVEVSDCIVEWSARDGIAIWDSSNVGITDNVVQHCGDNGISAHVSLDATEPARDTVRITDNILEDTAGISVLSAKNTILRGNQVRRPRGCGIAVGVASPDVQGDEPSFGVIIEGNTVTDAIENNWFVDGNSGSDSSGTYIRVGSSPLNAGALAAVPGEIDVATGNAVQLWGYLHEVDTDEAGKHCPGTYWVTIRGNTMVRALAAVANYDDWGYGTAIGVQGDATVNFDVVDIDLYATAIELRVPMRHVLIEGNTAQTGKRGVLVTKQANQALEDLLGKRIVIRGNDFKDCRLSGVEWLEAAPCVQDMEVVDNFFDCDPWMLGARRGAGGTWATTGDPYGIITTNVSGTVVRRNQFRNCNLPLSGGTSFALDNILRCVPVVVNFHITNIGIGTCHPPGEQWWYIIESADPTVATYGELLNYCARDSAAMPATGTYVAGMFIRSRTGAADPNGHLIGWARLTTGANNVAGTDWAEIRTEYGESASPYAAGLRLRYGGGSEAKVQAHGSAAAIDVTLEPKGAGAVRFGTVVADATETLAGRISIKDAAGNVVWLATVTPTP